LRPAAAIVELAEPALYPGLLVRRHDKAKVDKAVCREILRFRRERRGEHQDTGDQPGCTGNH